MRIVVDEMPKHAEDCLCCRLDNRLCQHYCEISGGACAFDYGIGCVYLVPIEEAYDEAMDERRRRDSLGYW